MLPPLVKPRGSIKEIRSWDPTRNPRSAAASDSVLALEKGLAAPLRLGANVPSDGPFAWLGLAAAPLAEAGPGAESRLAQDLGFSGAGGGAGARTGAGGAAGAEVSVVSVTVVASAFSNCGCAGRARVVI